MTTEEMLLQLIEGQKQISSDITNMKKDISDIKDDIINIKEDIFELKHEAKITRVNVNHNGEVLESLTDQLTNLNIVDVKY